MSRGRNARRGILAAVVAVLAVVLVAFGALVVKANSAYEDITRIDTAWCRTVSSFKDSTPAAFATGTRDTGPFVDTAPYLMPDYRTVSFPSREAGVTIAAWWVPATSAGAPAVVLVHGRGRCRGDPEVLLPAGMLHRHGFSVLLIDLRNHGGSTVTDGHQSVGVHEQTDVLGAWDWLRSAQSLPAERIGLYGVCLGAGSAIMAMGTEARVAAVWEDSSFASVEATMPKELVRNHLPEFLLPATVFAVRLFHDIDASQVRALAELRGRPFAIVHGTADDTVDVSNAFLLADAVRNGGGSVEPWILEGVQHVRASFVATAEYERRLVAFFSSALGPAGTTAAQRRGDDLPRVRA
jgi:dipeptidyl aminopeptidase/acylaminoacyl peptidase